MRRLEREVFSNLFLDDGRRAIATVYPISSFNLPAIASWERGWYTAAPIPSHDDEIPVVPRIPVSHKRLLVPERGFQSGRCVPLSAFTRAFPRLAFFSYFGQCLVSTIFASNSLECYRNSAFGIDHVTTRIVVPHAVSSPRDFSSKSFCLFSLFPFYEEELYVYEREREKEKDREYLRPCSFKFFPDWQQRQRHSERRSPLKQRRGKSMVFFVFE